MELTSTVWLDHNFPHGPGPGPEPGLISRTIYFWVRDWDQIQSGTGIEAISKTVAKAKNKNVADNLNKRCSKYDKIQFFFLNMNFTANFPKQYFWHQKHQWHGLVQVPVLEPLPEPVPEPIPEPVPEPIMAPVPEPFPAPVPEPILSLVPKPIPEIGPVLRHLCSTAIHRWYRKQSQV